MLTNTTWSILAAAILMGISNPARALDGNGITVTGTAEIKTRANAVEMMGVVAGEAELARDAIVKFQDNKRRVIDALEDLNIDNLDIQATGFNISHSAEGNQMQRMMMGETPDDTTAQVRISEPLLVAIEQIDQMDPQDLVDLIIQVIDAGKDAGMHIGGEGMTMIEIQMRGNQPSPLARFKLEGVEQLKQQAYDQAMKDARTRAERLASLAGVKLGRIVTVTESPAQIDENDPRSWMAMIYGAAAQTNKEEFTSDAFVEIPVSAAVMVQFEIEQ